LDGELEVGSPLQEIRAREPRQTKATANKRLFSARVLGMSKLSLNPKDAPEDPSVLLLRK
jgi:hypothetical protein